MPLCYPWWGEGLFFPHCAEWPFASVFPFSSPFSLSSCLSLLLLFLWLSLYFFCFLLHCFPACSTTAWSRFEWWSHQIVRVLLTFVLLSSFFVAGHEPKKSRISFQKICMENLRKSSFIHWKNLKISWGKSSQENPESPSGKSTWKIQRRKSKNRKSSRKIQEKI